MIHIKRRVHEIHAFPVRYFRRLLKLPAGAMTVQVNSEDRTEPVVLWDADTSSAVIKVRVRRTDTERRPNR